MYRSIQEFGVVGSNDADTNAKHLQEAIDWAAKKGAALFVEPVEDPYPISGGVVLRRNASLVGVHGPVGRGTRHQQKCQPVGSVFAITDEEKPFITVEGATSIRGIQFWYPKQTLRDETAVIAYPPTIKASSTSTAQGVTLSSLTFYGEYVAMDFACSPQVICEQVLFEHCYGYPLSGEFIKIDYCYDIPRILHCHVNPANRRFIDGGYGRAVVDSVISKGTFTYSIDHTDNAQLMDLFTFGTYGGIKLGAASYGQLTNFNFDCVTIGILKDGDNDFNRNWQIAQGSIIANTGTSLTEIHPILIMGRGHTSLANVECFSGPNPALTYLGQSYDFMKVAGSEPSTISIFGSRMRNYASPHPITLENQNTMITASACIDKDGRIFEYQHVPSV